ncbi:MULTISPECIES: SRPBCC family protein [Paraburkholderia]|uniref:Carbon monoxide dehydrogenase subunit G n=1 Tax=Paraburkholderia metrosideri TaxID=580937 RepID=A0ABW9E8B2_9BURK
MEMTGEQVLQLPRERVWAALNDPEILRASVPGCESLELIEENQYKVVMAAAVGPIKARFNGKLILTDLHAPESYSLTFEGSGGAAGFGKGSAQVNLKPDGDSTRLSYRANMQVGGRLAQLGARLIDGVARKMAEEFFGQFTAAIMEPASAEADVPHQDAGAPPLAAPMRQPVEEVPSRGARTWLWGIGLVVVVAAVAVYSLH